MPLASDILVLLQDLVGYSSIFFSVLLMISIYAAYEFNRRMQVISRSAHPETYRIFNYIRFLFFFLSMHFAASTLYMSVDELSEGFCLILTLIHIASYIGIGVIGLLIAISNVLALGRCGPKRQ